MAFSGFVKPFRPAFDAGLAAAGNGLLNGLLGYWPMDEASGDILDAHTGGRTVAAQTAIGSQTGKVYSTAREFNNSESDWALRTSDPMTVNAFTVGMWVYVYSLGVTPGIYRSFCNNAPVGNYSPGFQFFLNHEGQIIYSIAAGGLDWLFWHSAFMLTALNQWHSILFMHDPDTDLASVNFNGSLDTKAWTKGVGAGYKFTIGRQSAIGASGYMDGRIGPLSIWNRALTPTEQAAWYNAGAGLAYAAFTT